MTMQQQENSPLTETDVLLLEIAKLQEQVAFLKAENNMLKWRLHEQD